MYFPLKSFDPGTQQFDPLFKALDVIHFFYYILTNIKVLLKKQPFVILQITNIY